MALMTAIGIAAQVGIILIGWALIRLIRGAVADSQPVRVVEVRSECGCGQTGRAA